MKNRDEVIAQCIRAIAAHSHPLQDVFYRWLKEAEPARRAQLSELLHDVLKAQAEGHEASAHDGSTYSARVAACKAALAAWHEAPPLAEGLVRITLGSTVIDVDAALAGAAGFPASYWQATGVAQAGLAQALSEGFAGEAAVQRAAAILNERQRAVNADKTKLAVAEQELHAARVRRQAAMLECRAHGVNDRLND